MQVDSIQEIICDTNVHTGTVSMDPVNACAFEAVNGPVEMHTVLKMSTRMAIPSHTITMTRMAIPSHTITMMKMSMRIKGNSIIAHMIQ